EFTTGGEKTLYQYDSAGNRISLRQVRGDLDGTAGIAGPQDNLTTWEYDQIGRVTKQTVTADKFDGSHDIVGSEPISETWTYNGLETVHTDRDGNTITTTYDPISKTRTADTIDAATGAIYESTFELNSDGSLKHAYDEWSNAAASGRNGD